MAQKILIRIRFSEWTILICLVLMLIGIFYHSMIRKDTIKQIFESISIIGLTITLIYLRKLNCRSQIKMGLLKAYGKKVGLNALVLLYFGLGLISLTIGFLSFKDINAFVPKLTFGIMWIMWIMAGCYNMSRYYIQITDKNIVKLNLDFIKIKDLEMIMFSDYTIQLTTAKKIMNIFYSDLRTDEKQLIINDFEEIKLKNNLA